MVLDVWTWISRPVISSTQGSLPCGTKRQHPSSSPGFMLLLFGTPSGHLWVPLVWPLSLHILQSSGNPFANFFKNTVAIQSPPSALSSCIHENNWTLICLFINGAYRWAVFSWRQLGTDGLSGERATCHRDAFLSPCSDTTVTAVKTCTFFLRLFFSFSLLESTAYVLF